MAPVVPSANGVIRSVQIYDAACRDSSKVENSHDEQLNDPMTLKAAFAQRRTAETAAISTMR